MTKKGKFIVIEGNDSSGKEVQTRKLTESLKQIGYKVRFLDFPRYNKFFGRFIGKYLRGDFGDVYQAHPALASLPYALDRFEVKEDISNWISKGDLVVSNRFTGSNLAHMSAKLPKKERLDFIEWVEELEYERLGIPREDIAIFLHVYPEVGQKLTYKKDEKVYMKGLGRGDIHERDLRYLKAVTRQYLWLTENRKNWVEVNCMSDEKTLRSVEDIHEEVLDVLKSEGFVNF